MADRMWMTTFVDLTALLLTLLVMTFAVASTLPPPGATVQPPPSPRVMAPTGPASSYLVRLIEARLASSAAGTKVTLSAAGDDVMAELPAGVGPDPADWPAFCAALAAAVTDPAASVTLEEILADKAALAPALAALQQLAAALELEGFQPRRSPCAGSRRQARRCA